MGWGPGAKVLGSTHTGIPIDVPIVQTDVMIKPVRIEAWADVGTGAIVLPGITIGRGSLVGAGAVVTHDVPAFAVVAGVPARIIGDRRDPSRTGGPMPDEEVGVQPADQLLELSELEMGFAPFADDCAFALR